MHHVVKYLIVTVTNVHGYASHIIITHEVYLCLYTLLVGSYWSTVMKLYTLLSAWTIALNNDPFSIRRTASVPLEELICTMLMCQTLSKITSRVLECN